MVFELFGPLGFATAERCHGSYMDRRTILPLSLGRACAQDRLHAMLVCLYAGECGAQQVGTSLCLSNPSCVIRLDMLRAFVLAWRMAGHVMQVSDQL